MRPNARQAKIYGRISPQIVLFFFFFRLGLFLRALSVLNCSVRNSNMSTNDRRGYTSSDGALSIITAAWHLQNASVMPLLIWSMTKRVLSPCLTTSIYFSPWSRYRGHSHILQDINHRLEFPVSSSRTWTIPQSSEIKHYLNLCPNLTPRTENKSGIRIKIITLLNYSRSGPKRQQGLSI